MRLAADPASMPRPNNPAPPTNAGTRGTPGFHDDVSLDEDRRPPSGWAETMRWAVAPWLPEAPGASRLNGRIALKRSAWASDVHLALGEAWSAASV